MAGQFEDIPLSFSQGWYFYSAHIQSVK